MNCQVVRIGEIRANISIEVILDVNIKDQVNVLLSSFKSFIPFDTYNEIVIYALIIPKKIPFFVAQLQPTKMHL